MLKKIRLVLNKPYIDYDSTIVLSQLPEEMVYFRGNEYDKKRYKDYYISGIGREKYGFF